VDDARTAARRHAKATTESAQQLEGAVADLAALEAELKGAKEAAAEARTLAKAAAQELRAATAAQKASTKAFSEVDAARQRVASVHGAGIAAAIRMLLDHVVIGRGRIPFQRKGL